MEVGEVDNQGTCSDHTQETALGEVPGQEMACTGHTGYQVVVDNPVHIQDQKDAGTLAEHLA